MVFQNISNPQCVLKQVLAVRIDRYCPYVIAKIAVGMIKACLQSSALTEVYCMSEKCNLFNPFNCLEYGVAITGTPIVHGNDAVKVGSGSLANKADQLLRGIIRRDDCC